MNSDLDTVRDQAAAWAEQIELLKPAVKGLSGSIFLEFNIPRIGRRIDAVVLTASTIIILEFKVGATDFSKEAADQVWDYALDLKNFHEASHGAGIVPVLVATEARESPARAIRFAADHVSNPIFVIPRQLRDVLHELARLPGPQQLNADLWAAAPYCPTPTIIEAARALYARHSVDAIARNDAGATNLRITSRRIEDLVDEARQAGKKLICFVTGVPGAGKTLVGLNVATRRREEKSPTHAVFLSGNGPLVAVLREALTRDEQARLEREGRRVAKARAASPVKAFIQNVHHFRDEALRNASPPVDHVVIFDEAQRAWNVAKTASFMRRKKNQPNFELSEPAFLISYMDRHQDWAVVICLVGGGQEIHTGEAGIAEWLAAATVQFPHWQLYISDQLADSEYAAGDALAMVSGRPTTHMEPHLHLAVSMRSFRAENVSHFVKAMLDCDSPAARASLASLRERFPICLTRDLSRAKQWIRSNARGTERYGLVASSKAMRLKPYAIDIRVSVDPVQWFLQDADDTRANVYLEDCATEFQVQGLELDWACVNWDGDLRYSDRQWSYHDFRGNRWEVIRKPDRKSYLRNAYRVLLTRARQGMVIFVPRGDDTDPTRSPQYYDSTYRYLLEIGIPELA